MSRFGRDLPPFFLSRFGSTPRNLKNLYAITFRQIRRYDHREPERCIS